MASRFSRLELLQSLPPGSNLQKCLNYGGNRAQVQKDAERQLRCWEESAALINLPTANLELDLFPAGEIGATGVGAAGETGSTGEIGATGETGSTVATLEATEPAGLALAASTPPDLSLSDATVPSLQGLAGCDEVGRGPLAGPLVTAAVILPPGAYLPFLRDSKQLSHEERLALVPWIKARALAWAVVEISVDELNAPTANINSLSLTGMSRALRQLKMPPRFTLVDGKYPLPGWEGPQKAIIKGDDRCPAIAAASVLAKVHRDLLMVAAAKRWPQYGFEMHKGYGTASHLRALQEYGPCPLHRANYAPVRDLINKP